MPIFLAGDDVLCYFGDKLYPARCLEVDAKNSTYFVHYMGWKDRWNEWVSEERLAVATSTNMEKAEKNKFSKSSSSSPKKPSGKRVAASTNLSRKTQQEQQLKEAQSLRKRPSTQSTSAKASTIRKATPTTSQKSDAESVSKSPKKSVTRATPSSSSPQKSSSKTRRTEPQHTSEKPAPASTVRPDDILKDWIELTELINSPPKTGGTGSRLPSAPSRVPPPAFKAAAPQAPTPVKHELRSHPVVSQKQQATSLRTKPAKPAAVLNDKAVAATKKTPDVVTTERRGYIPTRRNGIRIENSSKVPEKKSQQAVKQVTPAMLSSSKQQKQQNDKRKQPAQQPTTSAPSSGGGAAASSKITTLAAKPTAPPLPPKKQPPKTFMSPVKLAAVAKQKLQRSMKQRAKAAASALKQGSPNKFGKFQKQVEDPDKADSDTDPHSPPIKQSQQQQVTSVEVQPTKRGRGGRLRHQGVPLLEIGLRNAVPRISRSSHRKQHNKVENNKASAVLAGISVRPTQPSLAEMEDLEDRSNSLSPEIGHVVAGSTVSYQASFEPFSKIATTTASGTYASHWQRVVPVVPQDGGVRASPVPQPVHNDHCYGKLFPPPVAGSGSSYFVSESTAKQRNGPFNARKLQTHKTGAAVSTRGVSPPLYISAGSGTLVLPDGYELSSNTQHQQSIISNTTTATRSKTGTFGGISAVASRGRDTSILLDFQMPPKATLSVSTSSTPSFSTSWLAPNVTVKAKPSSSAQLLVGDQLPANILEDESE